MWPFKKKLKWGGSTADHANEFKCASLERVNELKEFREIGEKFKYLGVEMIVTGHCYFKCIGFLCVVPMPLLTCDYVNKDGEIKHTSFEYRDLKALKAENGA